MGLQQMELINESQTKPIIQLFGLWAGNSATSQFNQMLSLVQPRSLFHELTKSCERAGHNGIQCKYQFSGIEVKLDANNPDEAFVKGSLTLELIGTDEFYRGTFNSRCTRNDKQTPGWLLDDVDIEWE